MLLNESIKITLNSNPHCSPPLLFTKALCKSFHWRTTSGSSFIRASQPPAPMCPAHPWVVLGEWIRTELATVKPVFCIDNGTKWQMMHEAPQRQGDPESTRLPSEDTEISVVIHDCQPTSDFTQFPHFSQTGTSGNSRYAAAPHRIPHLQFYLHLNVILFIRMVCFRNKKRRFHQGLQKFGE